MNRTQLNLWAQFTALHCIWLAGFYSVCLTIYIWLYFHIMYGCACVCVSDWLSSIFFCIYCSTVHIQIEMVNCVYFFRTIPKVIIIKLNSIGLILWEREREGEFVVLMAKENKSMNRLIVIVANHHFCISRIICGVHPIDGRLTSRKITTICKHTHTLYIKCQLLARSMVICFVSSNVH